MEKEQQHKEQEEGFLVGKQPSKHLCRADGITVGIAPQLESVGMFQSSKDRILPILQ